MSRELTFLYRWIFLNMFNLVEIPEPKVSRDYLSGFYTDQVGTAHRRVVKLGNKYITCVRKDR